MATIKIRNQSTVSSERPVERRELILDFKDDNIILKSTDENITNPNKLKIINEGVFLKKDEIASWAKSSKCPKLSKLSKEDEDDLPNLLKENPLEFAYEVATKQGYTVGSKTEWMEKCGVESLVPINDIYKVFKTYWNANSFVYTSMSAKAEDGTNNAGRRNAMWFGEKDGRNINIKTYEFKKGGSTKTGFPINCSSLAALVTLGIPYNYSRYTQTSKTKYELSDCDGGYTFNMYGDDGIIDITNYNAYFKANRQLSRCRELGLEVPALHLEWRPKEFDLDGNPLSSWYDIISPNSDLREAKPGDLIFWNNDGDVESDPRTVSHVVLVLARLSYDSRNPNQPLLLLAEATAGSTDGVQVSYYMYDESGQPYQFKSDNNAGSFIKLKDSDLSNISTCLYSKSDDDIYIHDPDNGKYLKLKHKSSADPYYAKIYDNLYIHNNENMKNCRYQTSGEANSEGLILHCINSTNEISNFTLDNYEVEGGKHNAKLYKRITLSGVNEHKIPKFICRPKYKRLNPEPYVDISKPIESAEYQISKDPDNDQTTITFNNSKKELYTLEFDWKPCKETTTTKPITEQKLVILNNSGKELLSYTLPDIQGGITYKGVRLILPINSYVSTSKKDEIGKISKVIRLQEQGKVKNWISRVPEISNIKIYQGIRLT